MRCWSAFFSCLLIAAMTGRRGSERNSTFPLSERQRNTFAVVPIEQVLVMTSTCSNGFFIALYEQDGRTAFFDVMTRPPRNRHPNPDEVISFDQLAGEITKTYDLRNDPPFEWADN